MSALTLDHPASAGEWTITPRAELEQSYTDNVRSVPEGAESDMITTASAGIGIDGIGRRLQLNFDYNISHDKFWDASDLDGFRHSLLGVGKVELMEDHVFLDSRASISRQSLVRNGTEAATDRNLDANDQTTVANYSITPNYGYRWGSWTETDVRISFNETRFLESDVGAAADQPETSRNVSITSLLKSGPNFNRISWQLLGSTTFTNDDSDRDLLELSSEYVWSRHLSLLGRLGQDTIEDSGINEDDGAELFWRGGVRVTPGPRSSLRVEYGERFGGSTFSGDASYRFDSRTAVSASYEVSVETDRERLTNNLNRLVVNEDGFLVDPITGQPSDPNSSEFDFRDETTRQERFTIALNGTRGRNTFGLSSSLTEQTVLTRDDEADTVLTFAGSIRRRIWPDLTGGISTSYSATTESADDVEDYSINGTVFLTYNIYRDFAGTLNYSLLHRNSDDDADDLQENIVSINLSKTF